MIKIVVMFTTFVLAMPALWQGKTLDPKEVHKRWGQKEFSIEAFKNGSLNDRAQQASDLIKKKSQFVGKNALEIKKILGPFSGHYFSESYPTYLIQKWTEEKPESWQLVFVIDRKNLVRDIVVHKNCCY